MSETFGFSRSPEGRLVYSSANGAVVVERMVPLFPITDPFGPFAVIGSEDRELAYYASVEAVPASERALVESELSLHLFFPRISAVVHVSTYEFPSVWQVRTDRGMTELRLSSEDCFRRLGRFGLLIREQSGMEFRVVDWNLLDKRTRRILERFL